MRKKVARVGAILALLALSFGPAGAYSTLRITNFMWGYETVKGVDVWSSGRQLISNGSFAAGAFTWKLDGEVKDTPLYCVDVFHSFYWGQQWQVECIPVPPGPSNPPPYNTLEAGWIYQKYGKIANKQMSAGLQLALWEITHDRSWRNQPTDAQGNVLWWKWDTGFDFSYRGVRTTAVYHNANAILQDLYRNFSEPGVGYSTYYRPSDPSSESYAQGQFGDGDPQIPEPGMLALLGIGLAGAAGAAWRKRARR